ncbi:MAG: TetR/AcrR family transcriptional regulator [Phototrophicaceae bacterium]|jgi:TetR/AcrR family fatty acid metabolism transcriptional regulator
MKDAIQEQLATARRDQILDAATSVFATKGFHPATIKDIAREAGIADGTIYNYFENKTALLIAIFARMQAVSIQGFDPTTLDPNDLRGFLTLLLRQPLKALQGNNFALFRVVMSEMLVNDELRGLYRQQILEPTLAMGEQVLQQWIDQHQIRQIPARRLMQMISGMVLGLMIQRTIESAPDPTQADDLPEQMADIILHGIANEKEQS